jgi:PDDEXK-like domain of unknown function (DUF3799)
MLTEPGVYDLPFAEYLADPCPEPSLSSGIAHRCLSQSPLHAFTAHPRLGAALREASDASDLGTIAHQIMLEGTDDGLVVVDAKDWRTKAAQEARDAARAAGRPAILAHVRGRLDDMLQAVYDAVMASEYDEAFARARKEQTIVWTEGPTWCRARPDVWDSTVLMDYKTTAGTAQPEAWARAQIIGGGVGMQAAHYRRAVYAETGELLPFIFMVQEQSAPYAVSFVGLDPAWTELVDRQWQAALALWSSCLRSGKWPGYGSRTYWMEPPAWHLARFEEQNVNLHEVLPE